MYQKFSILLVEDEYILYQELVEFFQGKGFEIIGFDDQRPVDNYEDALKLVKNYEPDLAVLDINIKGKKDGIELGGFIRRHYETPVVYLSDHDNFENINRIKLSGGDSFVLKADKPLNKKQLWATVQLLLPLREAALKKKTIGSFFKLKEVTITNDKTKRERLIQSEKDPVEVETFLKWEDIVYIESYNSKTARSGNNNLRIYYGKKDKGYIMRGTLNEIENRLPPEFLRTDQSTIINLNKITGRKNTGSVYFIGDFTFKIGITYKQKASEKLALFFSAAVNKNIPEID